MSFKKVKKQMVVIGGGTGTHMVLTGLKTFYKEISITAIVSMADSGGSTGRLRDEFGYLPVGDVRMALVALAKEETDEALLMRRLFLHRFDKGDGLEGHSVGNLFLVALTDLLGSEEQAVIAAAKILDICGTVVPVTTDDVNLVAEYDDGVVIEGESLIDEPVPDRADHRIVKLSTSPDGKASARALETITAADMIVIGPGDLYTSLLANIVIQGVSEAIKNSSAMLVFIANLMERPGQTKGMSVGDSVKELCSYIGRCPDVVCVNSASVPDAIAAEYALAGVRPLIDDADDLPMKIARADLLSAQRIVPAASDTLERSLVRHDSKKVAKLLRDLLASRGQILDAE